MTPANAARTCAGHSPVPSTSATAADQPSAARHSAHHPNGSPGGRDRHTGADTARSIHPRHHRRMPWNNHRPRAKTYGRAHQATRAAHMTALKAAGVAICAETRNPGSRCLHPSPLIHPTDDLHLCHNRRTGEVLGLGHADCNLAEAARHARRLQTRRRHRHTQPRARTDHSW